MTAPPEDPARLASLDAFRGFAIASMVLVNNPGDWDHLYAPLAHAPWHGWTFTDLVFPFFLFAAGAAMPLSLGRQSALGRGALVLKLARRAAVIFAIGLALNLFPSFDLATVRIPGVLQRIALCVLLAAPLVVYFPARALWAWIAFLLAAYTVPMLWLPVPDAQGVIAAGVLEPGRDAGAWLDRTLLGDHLWSKSRTWDPEGLLSTLPAACSLLFGVLAGHALLDGARSTGLFLAGIGALLAGLALEAGLMPINKNLWTPSYCVFMTGCSLLAFSAFHALMDAPSRPALQRAARRLFLPLTIFGMNALFLFAFSGFVARVLGLVRVPAESGASISLKAWLFAPLRALPVAPEAASLLYACAFEAAMFAVAWLLWKRRWFFKA